jgi:hypothetical protein
VSAERQRVARELLRRLRCQQSLHSFALNVDIPTAPDPAMHPDEDLLGPASKLMAVHHAKILEVMQRTMDRPFGRCIIQAPPGSAKSLYAVVASAWEMGRKPDSRLLYISYQAELAERQSRRVQLIADQENFRTIWPEQPRLGEKKAVGDWMLNNGRTAGEGANLIASGILSGITGNRATGWILDDPISGREAADSELERKRVYNAYNDDLKTRVLPGAWGILILTRWHELDPAGRILGDKYDGGSGMYKGEDGLDWEVLSIPAKCERTDDPLGRKLGEYMWPEWFPLQHWHMFEHDNSPEGQRTWASLYQQRPTPQGSGRLDEKAIDYYKPGTHPPILANVGAGDYAVSSGKNDFTELGVFGMDAQGHLWELDWWSEQCDTGKSTEKSIDMVARWRTSMWFNEGGVIDKAMGPLFNLRMRERQIFTDRRALPSMHDKLAKCQAFIARANAGTVHMRDNANSRRVIAQIAALPAGRFDDGADVCGLIGRALDQFPIVREVKPPEPEKRLKPFTGEWLEWKPQRRTGLREI